MRIWNPTTDEYDEYSGSGSVTSFAASLLDDTTQADALTTLGFGSGWQTYTPTWTTDGTAPAIGNGSINGDYLWLPGISMLVFYLRWIAGSTTTYGTNGWHFSTPPGRTITELQAVVGNAFDTSTPDTRSVGCTVTGTGLATIASGSGYISNGAPWTWANGDSITISGFCKAT